MSLTFERQLTRARTGEIAARRQERNGARGASAEGHAASRPNGQVYCPRGRGTWWEDMPHMREPAHAFRHNSGISCQQTPQQQPAHTFSCVCFLILNSMFTGGSVYVPLPRPKPPSREASKVDASSTASHSSYHDSFQKLRALFAAPDGESSLDLLRRHKEESSTLVRSAGVCTNP
jgi:hypothetical protein